MSNFIKQLNKKFPLLESSKKRWQDDDGDGIWYEPGEDVDEAININVDDIDDVDPRDLEKLKQTGNDINIVSEYSEDLDEISTTANAPAPAHKFAFSKKAKRKMKYDSVSEALDKKYHELIESYKQFSTDPNKSPIQKVNETIKEVAKKIKEIEEVINYTTRMKTESGISRTSYNKSTETALNKISEKLIRISERVRALGE
jgi:paraquat-inducible protein B